MSKKTRKEKNNMLIVSPVQTENEKTELCKLCGVNKIDGAFMYVANVDEKPVGISQFEITGEVCLIHNLANVLGKNDFEAMFIMARQTLNFCDICGSHDAYLMNADKVDERLKIAVGFKLTDDCKWYMDLRGFFEEHCKAE